MINPFIIAEIGVNHDGRIEKAVNLIDVAVVAGANAVKFQSFAAERLASTSTPKVAYQLQRDTNRSHFEMLKSLELSFNDQEYLYNYCNSVGIEFMSTPYSLIDASFLNSLGVQKFKVASADIVDIPLHELISSFGKLTLVSTGMASAEEISDVVEIYKSDKTSLVLMHTTSEYPASYLNANLEKILYLKSHKPEGIGYSDHTPDSMCSVMAVSYGCTYFEKHLTIDKSDPGPDHSASLNDIEFARYVSEIHRASLALGEIAGTRSEKEDDMARTSRKSLHFAKDLKTGAILQLSDLILLRPGHGIKWSNHSDILGKSLLRDVKKFELISSNDFSSNDH
jgi:N,N'-diacetyllegionaminate synthase